MKRITCLLVTVFVLAACAPVATLPTSVATALPTISSTVTSFPTPTFTRLPTLTATPVLTELQTITRIFPTATVTPMTVVPVSAGPLTLTEFNAGTEMKRLNVIGTGTPHDIEFSPDGKLFGVATERGVYLYDRITFEQKSFLDLNEPVDAIAFSPESDVLAAAVNGKVGLWSVLSGQKLLQFEGEIGVSSLAYGRGGHVAAVNWGQMMLWDAKTGHQIYEEENFENGYGTHAVTFTADGKQLVFGGKRGITTVESDTGKLVKVYVGSRDAGFPYDLIFNNDESGFMVSSNFFNKVTLMVDIATQKETTLSQCGLDLTRAKEIAACSSGESVVLIDGMSGQRIKSFDIDIEPNTNPDFLFALSPDGKLLAYLGKYGVYILETETGRKIKTLDFNDFHWAQAGMIEINGVEKYVVATLTQSGRVEMYDLQTGELIRTLKLECCEINGFDFAPDRRTFATLHNIQVSNRQRSILQIWDLQTGVVIYETNLGQDLSGPIAFSPDGASVFLTSVSEDEIIELDLQLGQTVNHGSNSYDTGYADPFQDENYHFNEPGNLVILGYDENTGEPLFTDVQTGQVISLPVDLKTNYEFIEAFTLSPDGQYLAYGNVSDIFVWNTATRRLQSQLTGHERCSGDGWIGKIRRLVFSPQSNLLVSVGWDGTIRLWSARFGTELRRLNIYGSVDFTPDGRYLITFDNGIVLVWGIPQ